MRSAIEQRLDRLLNRKKPEAIFADPEVQQRLSASGETDHLFVVFATAVAEVGRDHDYDWAMVEPSSMRSIIQLAGRVRRHRPDKYLPPNLLLLDTNISHLTNGPGKPSFFRPGFENRGGRLSVKTIASANCDADQLKNRCPTGSRARRVQPSQYGRSRHARFANMIKASRQRKATRVRMARCKARFTDRRTPAGEPFRKDNLAGNAKPAADEKGKLLYAFGDGQTVALNTFSFHSSDQALASVSGRTGLPAALATGQRRGMELRECAEKSER